MFWALSTGKRVHRSECLHGTVTLWSRHGSASQYTWFVCWSALTSSRLVWSILGFSALWTIGRGLRRPRTNLDRAESRWKALKAYGFYYLTQDQSLLTTISILSNNNPTATVMDSTLRESFTNDLKKCYEGLCADGREWRERYYLVRIIRAHRSTIHPRYSLCFLISAESTSRFRSCELPNW